MLRVWGKLIKKNQIKQNYIAVNNDSKLPLGERLHLCLDEICMELDLQRPIWLEQNRQDDSKLWADKFPARSFYRTNLL